MGDIKQFLEYGILKWRGEHKRIQEILGIYEKLLTQLGEGKLGLLSEKDIKSILRDAHKYPFYEELRRDYRIFNLLKKDQ